MKNIVILLISYFLLLYGISNANAANPQQEAPTYIEYDDLIYDQEHDIIIFKGNVLMMQGNEILSADEIHYHKANENYYAKGNVAILKEDGSVYFADVMNINRVLYKGKALNFKGRMTPQGLIAASEVEMYDKHKLHLDNVRFSICNVCKNSFLPNVPLWQIQAREATIDRSKESIVYKNASLEILGTSVLYTPYLVTSTPGAKRKSGFLFPTLKWSNELGVSIRTPYYWNIAPNMDATAAVRFYSLDSPLIEGQFRHLLENGEYTINATAINTKKVLQDGTIVDNQKQIRASYDFKSIFQVPNDMVDTYMGLYSMRVHDKSKTYLTKYHIAHEDVLTTNGFIKNFWDEHNYVFLDTLYFQNLNTAYTNITWNTSPRIVPWLRSSFSKDLDYNNSKLSFDIDALNLYRHTGSRYHRFYSKISYKLPILLPYGQLFEFGASIRGDHYQINHSKIEGQSLVSDRLKGDASNYYPQVSFEWMLPLVNYTTFGILTLTPMIKIILEPNKQVSPIIPNEDSQFFELSALNLMSEDRYLGIDRLEVGPRVNYGVQGNLTPPYLENIGFKAGQVFNVYQHDNYGKTSGLMENKSDYVGEIYIQPVKEAYIIQKMRVDDKTLSMVRHDTTAAVNIKEWTFSLNYMKVGKNITASSVHKIYNQDLMSRISYNIYDHWWVGGHMRTKLGKKIPGMERKIVQGAHINYLGDCLHTFFTVERDYTQLKDLKPSITYAFNVQIPGF